MGGGHQLLQIDFVILSGDGEDAHGFQGTVTEFEPAAQGVVTQAGGVQQSHVAIDLKLVDTKTSRVVSTTTVTGKATDISLSTKNLQYAGVSPLYFMQMWANTPIEFFVQ